MAATISLHIVVQGLILWFPAYSRQVSGRVETITVNTGRGPLYLVAAVSFVPVLVLAFSAMRRERQPLGCLLSSIGFLSPTLWLLRMVGDLGPYVRAGSVQDRDGAEYCLLKSSFLQGGDLVIVRLVRRAGFTSEYELLVRSPWDEDLGYLSVIRPQDKAHDAELYLTKDRTLVGVPYGNKAYLAYDLNAHKPYSQRLDFSLQGYVDIRELSPFLLLGRGDVPRQSDFRTLLNPKAFGRPFPQAVVPDLKNPNPKVRNLAKRLLSNLYANPPEPK